MLKHVIQGSPGTGKTTTLATVWIPKAAAKYGPSALVVCSLTKAAARVIAARVASLHIPEEQVGNIHKLLYHAMGRPQILEAKDLSEWNETQPLQWRVSPGITARGSAGRSSDYPGDVIHRDIDLHRANILAQESWTEAQRDFYDAWSTWKETTGAVEFTDMVEMALESGEQCPGHPKVLFVDEAQDYSALEMALVESWGQHCEYYVLAGDPNQAIFVFRGADPTLMMEGAEKVWALSKSYRCSDAIKDYAEGVLAHAKVKYPVEYESTGEPGVVCRGVLPNGKRGAPQHLLGMLEEHETVMYLASCRYMLPIAELKERGIPFHNPYAVDELGMNPLALRSHKGPAHRLRALLSPRFPRLVGSDKDPAPWTWAEMEEWTKHLATSGLMKKGAKRRIEERAGVNDYGTAKTEISPADFTDLFENMNLLQCETPEEALDWFECHLLGTQRAAYDFPLRVGNLDPANLYREPRLIVGTVHSVKGGEADAVVLSPDMSRAAHEDYRRGEQDAMLRLMYVGATRARTRLDITLPQTRHYVEVM